MKPFKSKKAIWWAVGIGVLIVGTFAAAIFLPSASKPYGAGAPDINVPSMKNVPSSNHKLDLEVPAESN